MAKRERRGRMRDEQDEEQKGGRREERAGRTQDQTILTWRGCLAALEAVEISQHRREPWKISSS
eukprot:751007-Hanusia_phi.AAC.1